MTGAPVEQFETSDVLHAVGNVTNKTLSIWDMFIQAEVFVQLIMILLIIMSILSWAIIIDKFAALRALRRDSILLEAFFRASSVNNVGAFEQIYSVFLRKLNILGGAVGVLNEKMNTIHKSSDIGDKSVVTQEVGNRLKEIFDKIEDRVYILNSVSSAAPFIGLLGTVWGIMNSFQSIALMKSASIPTVAPGIAEALLATALGLLVAIPAFIAHNAFYSVLYKRYDRIQALFNKIIKNSYAQ